MARLAPAWLLGALLAAVACPSPAALARAPAPVRAGGPRSAVPDAASAAGVAALPVFPDAYEMEFELTLPYVLVLQPGGLKYKVHVWVDKAAGAVRVDYDGGEQQELFVQDKEFAIHPRKYTRVCREYRHGGGPVAAGTPLAPTAAAGAGALPAAAAAFARRLLRAARSGSRAGGGAGGSGAPALAAAALLGGPLLPDMSKDAWTEAGAAEVNGRRALMWRLRRPQEAGDKMDEYYFAVTPEGVPLLLHSVGRDLFGGSHYDEYNYDFKSFKAGPVDPKVFEVPSICNKPAPTNGAAAAPPAAARRGARSKGRVAAGLVSVPPLEVFQPALAKADLPSHLDWRGTPADFAVKDQAQCGSCWAFAATGAMEGAWFVATGSGRTFSEQQLIDCAWDEGVNGCDGGDAQPAFAYISKAGGIAQTQDYPYRGINGWCRDNSTRKEGYFTGYGQVHSRDEAAVMEALMRHGPLAVGVDAEFDFTYYSGGVYAERRCALKPRKLDHAVVLVGFGTREGQDYWIVRNSWSKFWGVDGYIYMKRGGNDCGIASDAVYAIVGEQYSTPGAPAKALALALANGRRLAAADAAAAGGGARPVAS